MLSAALEQLEYCYELTDEKDTWMVRDSEDVSLHHDACVHLHRIYTKLAISALEDGDPDTSVNYYLKAYNAAREGPCVVNSSASGLELVAWERAAVPLKRRTLCPAFSFYVNI